MICPVCEESIEMEYDKSSGEYSCSNCGHIFGYIDDSSDDSYNWTSAPAGNLIFPYPKTNRARCKPMSLVSASITPSAAN